MPRRMAMESRERVVELMQQNPKAVGPRLAYLSMNFGIPAKAFAQLLQASEPTIYRWFYGESAPRDVYMPNIRRLISVFRAAALAGDIPLTGTYDERMQAVRTVVLKHKPKRQVQ